MTAESLKAIIVDDESLARGIIREYLSRHSDIDVVAECGNGFEAVKAITELAPDIVFLDIQMPKLDGFEVLELVDGAFAVVFVTAHDEHALKAFDVNAVDYLLKPFTSERFDRALSKAFETLHTGDAPAANEKARSIRRHDGGESERVLIKDGTNVHILPLESISHIEARDDYVSVVSRGKKYLKEQSLRELEERLPQDRFIRIHRSTLLNIDFLARIETYAKDSRVAILKDGSRLNISRSGYDRLKSRLET